MVILSKHFELEIEINNYHSMGCRTWKPIEGFHLHDSIKFKRHSAKKNKTKNLNAQQKLN